MRDGLEAAIARSSRVRAADADVLSSESATPTWRTRARSPTRSTSGSGAAPAYNCSPSFNWKRHLDDAQIATFQQELGAIGYRFQFITLAGFHSLNAAMFELARGYAADGMLRRAAGARVRVEADGFTATPATSGRSERATSIR